MASFIPPLSRWFPITSPFGSPTAAGPHAGEPHTAIDFGAPFNEPIFSMADGIVLAPNGNPEGVTGGNTVTIDYGNGIIATFAHLNTMLVKPGDRVGRGQQIGTVGNTGITTGTGGTSGSHLHLDVWENGKKINPLDLFDWTEEAINPAWYGGQWSVASVIEWLTESTAEDVGNRTWGQYIDGINTDFVGGLVKSKDVAAAINQLGWRDKVIASNDLPTVAAAIFSMGPLDAFTSSKGDNWGAAIVEFVAAILNPETWVRVAALVLGFIMAGAGAYMIWTTT